MHPSDSGPSSTDEYLLREWQDQLQVAERMIDGYERGIDFWKTMAERCRAQIASIGTVKP